MAAKLHFQLDYLSDFSNLVAILSGNGSEPLFWELDFKVSDESLKKLRDIERSEFKEIEAEREIGDSFEDWREKCEDHHFWPLLEWLNSRYHVYWNGRRRRLKEERDAKKDFWEQNFSDFFDLCEEVTGFEWDGSYYRCVVSDTMNIWGCTDNFDRSVVYIGAHSDFSTYKYVIVRQLLTLLIEGENISGDFFGTGDSLPLFTRDMSDNLIGLMVSEVTDISFMNCLRYLTYAPERRWVLMKKVLNEYGSKKDFEEMAENIKSSLDTEFVQKYSRIYEMEKPVSLLLD